MRELGLLGTLIVMALLGGCGDAGDAGGDGTGGEGREYGSGGTTTTGGTGGSGGTGVGGSGGTKNQGVGGTDASTGGQGTEISAANLCARPNDVLDEQMVNLELVALPSACTPYIDNFTSETAFGDPIHDADVLRDVLDCPAETVFNVDFSSHAVVTVSALVFPSTAVVDLEWAAIQGTVLRIVHRERPYCTGAGPSSSTIGYYLVPAAVTEVVTTDCNTSSCNWPDGLPPP